MFVSQMLTKGLSVGMFVGGVVAQSGAWQQCGGSGWSGSTTCVSGYTCQAQSQWYSQCVPSANQPPTTTAAPTSTTGGGSGGSGSATKTGGGTNPGATLVPGWFWIRAVAPPNYHSYLQAQPTGVPGDAYLSAASRAGQYSVEAGQLVYHTGGGGSLYLHVENPADKTQRTLKTWFAAEKNDYGAFAFQGDTLTWHVADIARPNEAAWLVCEGQHLFVNTGAYGYQTPAGCADQTIHSYGGSTPDV